MADFATTRQVRARKAHKCGECFRAIDPGDTYERAAGVWEGDFWDLKTCAHCAAFRTIINQVDTEFSDTMYGGIHAWVDNVGSSPAELAYYYSRIKTYTLLSLHRWSRQFGHHWHYGIDPIPTIAKAD
jgi:hypothetical protein